MRIDQLISQLLTPISTAPLRRQSGVGGSGSAGGDTGGRRGYGNLTSSAPTVGLGDVGQGSALAALIGRGGDQIDLTTLLASRLGASNGQFAEPSTSATAATAASEGESTGAGGAEGTTILDSSYRTRATLALRFPRTSAYGPEINFTFTVDQAYRRIDIVPTGLLVDAQG